MCGPSGGSLTRLLCGLTAQTSSGVGGQPLYRSSRPRGVTAGERSVDSYKVTNARPAACVAALLMSRQIPNRTVDDVSRKLHVVVDDYATHKHPNVRAWLA